MKKTASTLPTLSSFTFGCMSLGNNPGEFRDHIGVARAAMDGGGWFHASPEYAGGGAYMIMRHAFAEAKSRIPKLILKIRCDHAAVLKFDVEDALRRLNIERIDLAQLSRAKHDHRLVVDDYLNQGEMWQVCQNLQKEGKVGHFVMEVFASFSADAIRAVNAKLFPAYIFYFNPGERQTTNEFFGLLEQKEEKFLSLRTLCGGMLDPLRIQALQATEPNHPAIARFEALKPIYERSGCDSWCEFSMSFLKSFPNLLTTIAGTSKMGHLKELLETDRQAKPMAAQLAAEIKALHAQWSGST
jgi:aryl-alcohol dehydrogenase-like predicted oxidoreductase